MTAPRREPLAKEPLDLSQFEGLTPGPWEEVEREILEDGSVYPKHIVGGSRRLAICPLEDSYIADAIANGKMLESDAMAESPGDIRSKAANHRLLLAAPRLLSELLEARERIEKQETMIANLRDYIDHATGMCDCGAAEVCNKWTGNMAPFIGLNPNGTWCEPKAKDAKEGNDAQL